MIAKLFVHKTDCIKIQLLRYLFVGGIAFAVDFGVLYLLTSVVGVHYLISNLFAFLLGLATNYLLSVRWVFSQRKITNRKKEFVLFGIIGVVGLLLNQLVLWGLTEWTGLFYLYSKIFATGAVFLWNFLGRRYLVFY